MRDVDADPLAFEFFGRMHRRAATAEWVEDHIPFVGRSADDAFEQSEGFLRGVTKTFLSLRVNW